MKLNKKVAASFVTIAATLTAVVGITLASFSDSVTLSSNVLDTATPNLRIASDNPCTSFSTSAIGISTSSMVPGGSDSKTFCLKNDSEATLSFNITATAHRTSGSLDTSLVTITISCDLGPAVPVAIDGPESNVIVTISGGGTVSNCVINQSLSGLATNGASNKSLHYTITFIGTQSS
jgi:hypothetical protein